MIRYIFKSRYSLADLAVFLALGMLSAGAGPVWMFFMFVPWCILSGRIERRVCGEEKP